MKNHTNKKMLSVTDQMDLYFLYSGIAWIILGISIFFDHLIFTIVEAFCLSILIFTHIFVIKAKKENQDELSIKNYHKARSHVLTYMHLVYFAFILIAIISNLLRHEAIMKINITHVLLPLFFVSLGIEYFLVGILFRKYEREGEECIF